LASPRAIRIPRASSTEGTDRAASTSKFPARAFPAERRPNTAGTQRATRLTLIYLLFLGVLYVGFLLLDRAAPGGSSLGADNGTYSFTLLAVILAIGGPLVSLHPAPRSVETSPVSTVVVGRWGRRHTYPPLSEIDTREVRRYPAGLLSSEPVLLVEVGGGPSPRGTFLLEEGLVPVASRGR
jgi:hypothetical protein